MVVKINSEKYIEFFREWPNPAFALFGWDYVVKYYFFSTIPVMIYTKPLTK